MPRKYEKVQELLPEVKRLKESGYTYRQIAEKFGLSDGEVVRELLKRERRKAAQGVSTRRGRKPAKTLQEYKRENKRLKMEVELLRDFLSLTGKERKPASNTRSSIVIGRNTASVRCAVSSTCPEVDTMTMSSAWTYPQGICRWLNRYAYVRSSAAAPMATAAYISG